MPSSRGFVSSANDGHSPLADLTLLATVPQSQGLLQNGLHAAGKLAPSRSAPPDHFSAASQQMRQATLMRGPDKLTIDAPAIPHQETVKVRPQHFRGPFKPVPRLNGIHRNLGTAESPHLAQPSAVRPNGSVPKVEIRAAIPVWPSSLLHAVIRWKYAPASAQTIEEVTFSFNPK
jgi:hypothetical protein